MLALAREHGRDVANLRFEPAERTAAVLAA
jgi:hypothetical protein